MGIPTIERLPCDDYNIETRNDNVSKLKAILPHKEARAMSILQRASS